MMNSQDQTDLLNAIIGTIQSIHADIKIMRADMDLIRQAQIEHGRALEDLSLRVDRHIWDSRPKPTPVPLLCGSGNGSGK